jgi:hypothetical protein
MSSVVWRREALLTILNSSKNQLISIDFAYDWILYSFAIKIGFDFYYCSDSFVMHRQHRASMSRVGLDNHIKEINKCHRIFSLNCNAGKHSEQQFYISLLKKNN